jgi:hypothetical protein
MVAMARQANKAMLMVVMFGGGGACDIAMMTVVVMMMTQVMRAGNVGHAPGPKVSVGDCSGDDIRYVFKCNLPLREVTSSSNVRNNMG